VSDRRRDGPPSRSVPICPICTPRHPMAFACRVVNMEIFGCKQCGSTLTVPSNPGDEPIQR
jgi:hypothetical protein